MNVVDVCYLRRIHVTNFATGCLYATDDNVAHATERNLAVLAWPLHQMVLGDDAVHFWGVSVRRIRVVAFSHTVRLR